MKPVPPVMTTLPVGKASMVGAFNIGLALRRIAGSEKTLSLTMKDKKATYFSKAGLLEPFPEYCSDDILVIDRRGFSEFYPLCGIAAGLKTWLSDPQLHGTFP